jgi:hypothetical protein
MPNRGGEWLVNYASEGIHGVGTKNMFERSVRDDNASSPFPAPTIRPSILTLLCPAPALRVKLGWFWRTIIIDHL